MFLIVDGNNLVCQTYYSLTGPQANGETGLGLSVSIVRYLLHRLQEVADEHKCKLMAVVFDQPDSKTFRHVLYPEYKGNRKEKPEGLTAALVAAQAVLSTTGFSFTAPDGYEADDLIASFVDALGCKTFIYSTDQDLLGLVCDTVSVINPRNHEVMTPLKVYQKLGVYPRQVADYKALKGDPSDFIPGVKGIGEKLATQLITAYGSVIEIYEQLEEIEGKPLRLLTNGREDALLFRELTGLVSSLEVPLVAELYAVEHLQRAHTGLMHYIRQEQGVLANASS